MKITVLSFQALERSTGTIHRQPVPEKIGVTRSMERGAGHDMSQVPAHCSTDFPRCPRHACSHLSDEKQEHTSEVSPPQGSPANVKFWPETQSYLGSVQHQYRQSVQPAALATSRRSRFHKHWSLWNLQVYRSNLRCYYDPRTRY